MLIAIISDSHDNLANLEKFLIWINDHQVKAIIHCGDIAAPAIVKEMAAKFFSPIHLVYGNVADRELLPKVCADLEQVTLHGDQGILMIENQKIAFCHFSDQAKELARGGQYDLVFYGHTHQPWEEKIGDCRLVNPGTLAGLFAKATFAVYDTMTKKLDLKILERI